MFTVDDMSYPLDSFFVDKDPVEFMKKLMKYVYYPEVNVDFNVFTKRSSENLKKTWQFPPEQKVVLKSKLIQVQGF